MFIPDFVQQEDDYKACIDFHGHTCMGVTIGYLAAKLALEWLAATRAKDEELIAIVENDACCCDAIQVLTGCTFGKGNFFFRDYGKMVFTFGNRATGEAIRLVLNQEAFSIPEEEQQLAKRIGSGHASNAEKQKYQDLFESRSEKLFQQGPGAFFSVEKIALTLPPHATRAPSTPCELCKEMVMETKLEDRDGQKICRGCLASNL